MTFLQSSGDHQTGGGTESTPGLILEADGIRHRTRDKATYNLGSRILWRDFWGSTNPQRKTREDVRSTAEWVRALVTKDVVQVKVLNDLFVLVFTGKICLQEMQAPETGGKGWSEEDSPLLEEDQVREHLKKSNIHSLWDLAGYTHECWRSLLMSLWGHSWLSLKGQCDQKGFLRIGRQRMSLLFSRSRRMIWETTG